MSLRGQRSSCGGPRAHSGQIAIFIALIFQLLFVFFAMAINVALVVHDKINLQNATDLAAYYAASKQAELLNVIAHENYQIRQAFKLLVFRYRVWGAMGIDNKFNGNPKLHGHPTNHPVGGEPDDIYEETMADGSQQRSFAACVHFNPTWDRTTGQKNTADENICNRPDITLPKFPTVNLGDSPFGIARVITQVTLNLQEKYTTNCDKAGSFNRYFAESALAAFALDQKNRKDIIYAIARNLSKNWHDVVDLDGGKILTGTIQTLKNNLSYANSVDLNAFDENHDFEMLNSLEGIDEKDWLRPMVIPVDVPYGARPSGAAGTCALRGRKVNPNDILDNAAAPIPSYSKITDAVPADLAKGVEDASHRIFNVDAAKLGTQHKNYFPVLGVEKNPWYMAYIGIKTKTTPRPLFFPFGKSVVFKVRSFAKPFGGTIGPWLHNMWTRGAADSEGQRIDAMAPDRTDVVIAKGNSAKNDYLNYSRFPGDKLGLQSRLALAAFQGTDASCGGQKELRNCTNLLAMRYLAHFADDPQAGSPIDYLVRDAKTGQKPPSRNYEIAAIAPDLFDVTYYSIEPNFSAVYLRKLLALREPLEIGNNAIRGDLGGMGETTELFNINDQIKIAREHLAPEAFWALRKVEHVLTGFAYDVNQLGEYNFTDKFPLELFGKCQDDDGRRNQLMDNALPFSGSVIPNPGSCIVGGRTGYSVKLVSESWLNSENIVNGSKDLGLQGPILNSPNERGF